MSFILEKKNNKNPQEVFSKFDNGVSYLIR